MGQHHPALGRGVLGEGGHLVEGAEFPGIELTGHAAVDDGEGFGAEGLAVGEEVVGAEAVALLVAELAHYRAALRRERELPPVGEPDTRPRAALRHRPPADVGVHPAVSSATGREKKSYKQSAETGSHSHLLRSPFSARMVSLV